MKTVFKTTLSILISTILSCSLQESYPEGDMTLIFYLGNSSISPFQLEDDIDELTKKYVNISNKRVTILYDGADEGDSRLIILDTVFGAKHRKLKLSDAGFKTDSKNEVNMADPDTLETYLKFVKDKIPSKYYTLYFGAHGNGYRSNDNSGLEVENRHQSSDYMLEITEIETAILNSNGVNTIVFDVCLMGNIENIYQLKNTADYIVASPESIPGSGNNYELLIESYYSETEVTPLGISHLTLETYYNHYNELQTQSQNPWIKDKDILAIYDVKGIVSTINSNNFEDDILKYAKNTPYFTYHYDRNNLPAVIYPINEIDPRYYKGEYIELDNDDLNNYIYTRNNDSPKLISIYRPTTTYNMNYANCDFAEKFPKWTEYLIKR